jgi:hypothetical protein
LRRISFFRIQSHCYTPFGVGRQPVMHALGQRPSRSSRPSTLKIARIAKQPSPAGASRTGQF